MWGEMQVVSEDCLYLTLATPALDGDNILTNSSLPVMVAPRSFPWPGLDPRWVMDYGKWRSGCVQPRPFHGQGGSQMGHCQDVVHVGVNYRLGALGFLALEGETGGNQGLRDQVGHNPKP